MRREYHGNVTIEASRVLVVVGDNVPLIEPVSFTIYPSELVGTGKTMPRDLSPCATVPDSMSDAAVPSVPKFYVAKKGDCSARPAAESTPDRLAFRPTLLFCLLMLGGMLVALVVASFGFLRMRDVQ